MKQVKHANKQPHAAEWQSLNPEARKANQNCFATKKKS